MRVWLLQGEDGEDAESLEPLLHLCVQQLPALCLQVECQRGTSRLVSNVRRQPPDLLLVAHPHCPPLSVLAEVLPLGVSLLLATPLEQAEAYTSLAGRYPIHLIPLPLGPEALALGLQSAAAAHSRQLAWSAQVAQLQQRLQDRILIERAKGVLVQRLGISEEDAYKRLRVLSRQQRRPIRDIAQSVLDAQLLLLPASNGLHAIPPRPSPQEEPRASLSPQERAPAPERWPEKVQAFSKE